MSYSLENTPYASVLLVDDNVALLRSMAFLMKIAGLEVVTATDGEKALEALQNFTPDLIISDVQMPNVDGHDFLKRVRAAESWKAIPFVFMSACYSLDDMLHGLDLGANDYMPKPFDIYDVLDVVKRALPGGMRFRRAG